MLSSPNIQNLFKKSENEIKESLGIDANSGKSTTLKKLQLRMEMTNKLKEEEKITRDKLQATKKQLKQSQIEISKLANECKAFPKDRLLRTKLKRQHEKINTLQLSVLGLEEQLEQIEKRKGFTEKIEFAAVTKTSIKAQQEYINVMKNEINPMNIGSDISKFTMDMHLMNEGMSTLDELAKELDNTITDGEKSKLDRLYKTTDEDIDSLLDMYSGSSTSNNNNNNNSTKNRTDKDEDEEEGYYDEDEEDVTVANKLNKLLNMQG